MTEFTKQQAEISLLEFQRNDLLDEIQRLKSKLSAYENDLVLLDVSDKLKKAEARIAELEARIDAYEADDPYLCIRYQPPKDGE